MLLFMRIGHSQNTSQKGLESIDGVVHALLDAISLNKGEKMDTAYVRSLFLPSARLTMLSTGDSASLETVNLDEFLIMLTDPYYENGYSEREISKEVHKYNGIAQVFQKYTGEDSEGETQTGFTSYQLAEFEGRWWIVNLLWTPMAD